MKQSLILLFAVIIFAGNVGCKKNKDNLTRPIPPSPLPHEKKWVVSTVAGDGRPVYADGSVSTASFRLPFDVVVAANGVIYVSDLLNHRIRKIDAGMVTTFAGSGRQDTINGTGTSAGYSFPCRLAIDRAGDLLTLDFGDARIRKITTAGLVSTYAGTVAKEYKDGPVATAQFNSSFGIDTDADDNIYIGDSGNRRIRKISADGQVITIAGTGEMGFKDGNGDVAQFFFPQGVVIDKQGNLFVADQNRIRKITSAGVVSTFAGNESTGTADGQAGDASFIEIEDMVIDDDGNIYAADENRIRKISPAGVVSTIAGSTIGYQDGEGSSAKFNGAFGLGIDRQGTIYVADGNNNRIRKISFE